MDQAKSFKSENLERDCGGCTRSPFYEKYIQYAPTPSPHEFVLDFLQNYTNRDYNRSEPVVQMICEVKKVYKCQHRLLHTVFSTRKFSKMELMNLPTNHVNDGHSISWQKLIDLFTMGIILQEIAESRIDMELHYDVQDMLIYALKHVNQWFVDIGGWATFVNHYKNMIF